MSAPLQNTFFKTSITGNLDIAGNLYVNSQNVYLGYLAGNANPGGGTLVDNMKNVAIGASCATYQTGSKNVSIGYDAATNGTITYSGANNVSIGYNSGFNSCSTSNGVALGVNSLVDFSGSIAIGSAATATGFRNIAIGASAFSTGNTSSIGNSIAIGVGASTVLFGNSVAIGSGATCNANNQITIGTNDHFLSLPCMNTQYISYTLTTANQAVNTASTPTLCPFNSVESQNTSLFTNSAGTFTNSSGRTLCCCVMYNTSVTVAGTASYSLAYILANGSRYASQTINTFSSNIVRLNCFATILLPPNGTIQCYSLANGATAGATNTYFTTNAAFNLNRCSMIVF